MLHGKERQAAYAGHEETDRETSTGNNVQCVIRTHTHTLTHTYLRLLHWRASWPASERTGAEGRAVTMAAAGGDGGQTWWTAGAVLRGPLAHLWWFP